MSRIFKTHQGFSLVEVILASAIFAILSATVVYYYSSMSKQGEKLERESQFINTSRNFLATLKADIRSAELIRFAENELHIEASILTPEGFAESRDIRYQWDKSAIERRAISYEEESSSGVHRYDYVTALQENEQLLLIMQPLEIFGNSHLARVYTIEISIINSTNEKVFTMNERVYLEQL